MTESPDIKYFFEPRGIAIIGASHSRDKIGYKILENIGAGGYSGKVYPVNPEGGEILGLRVYKTIEEVEGIVDVAFIVIPAKYVYEAIKGCGAKGVKFVSIISSGFSEVGDVGNEKKIVSYALEHGMRVLGPNIFGVYIAKSSLNATFGIKDIRAGGVAIITQSGALGISLMGRTAVENIGLSAMFSVGNKSDIDESDLLEYLVKDERTKIIMIYIEGVKRGERLISVLKKAARIKPVIVIKAGRSKRGAVAAASHTGSLAGSDAIFSDVMKQCAVIRAESLQEALAWCRFISLSPKPKGENTVIITNGGGMGVLAADACEKYGINLYDDAAVLKETFSSVVPAFGSLKNPVDLTGQATIEDYRKAITAAMNNKEIHSVICLGCETSFFEAGKLSGMIRDMFSAGKPAKPIVFSFFGGAMMDGCVAELNKSDLVSFIDVYEAVSCMGALYINYRNGTYRPGASGGKIRINSSAIREVLKKAAREDRRSLLANEAEAVMTAAGINLPKSRLARSIGEAIKYAGRIGYPVVMKVVSKDIIHKSDAGAVALNIENEEEVMDAYQAIMYNSRKYRTDAKIEGIEIMETVSGSAQLIVGAVRDASFGPVVMFGLGGIYVEILGDVSFRAFPLDRKEVLNMIHETKASRLLSGVRGEKKKDINSLVDSIIKLGLILEKHKEITDIEINPLIVHEEGGGSTALDVRILLSKTGEAK